MAKIVLAVFACILITGAQATCDITAFATCTSSYATEIASAGTDVTKLCAAYNGLITCGTNADCLSSITAVDPGCSDGMRVTYSLALMIAMVLLQFVKII